jgi:FKBP-type peptidyl-prolyl cis-trans isomerase 2
MAMVVAVGDELVMLDANSMMAGKMLTFELEIINIERNPAGAAPKAAAG